MNKIFTLFTTLTSACEAVMPVQTAMSSQASCARTSEEHEAIQQVRAVDESRRLAVLHGDVKALDSLLADDATILWGDGTADDKASTLELFRSGRLRYRQLEYDNTRVQMYGDVVVVTGKARVQAQSGEQALEHVARVTRVYTRKQDRWRLVMRQTTRVEPVTDPSHDATGQAKAQEAPARQDDSSVIFFSAKHLDSQNPHIPRGGARHIPS